jgi:hypothetical protein
MPELSLLKRPYAERQLIVVVPDRMAKAKRQAAARAVEGRVDWNDVFRVAVKVGKVVLPFAAILEAVDEASGEGVDVVSVGRSEASALTLPPGHPRDRVVYVGHPAVPELYYGVAQFHRFTFEHKFAEAIQLLMALGATSLRVESVKGWSQEMAASISAPIPGQPVQVGVEGGQREKIAASALFEARQNVSLHPQVPDGLVWYPHEPTWRQIADGRLNSGLTSFQLALSYEDDYGVNLGLKAKIDKYGLEVGGSFEEHVSTLWKLSGEFKES